MAFENLIPYYYLLAGVISSLWIQEIGTPQQEGNKWEYAAAKEWAQMQPVRAKRHSD